MDRRLKLQEELERIPGVRKVYYQPPESVKLQYDCIVYNLRNIDILYADDVNYRPQRSYDITVIYKNQDSPISESLIRLFPAIRFDRHYVADNLYHDSFVLYY